MIDPNLIRDFAQKVWDETKKDDGPGEPITLREYNRRAKRLRTYANQQE